MSTFFKTLAETMDGTMSITILKKDDTLTVSVLPKVGKDTTIIPFTLSGTPEEIDEAFFEQINSTLEKVKGLQSNAEEVEQSIEDAKPKPSVKKVEAKKETKKVDKKTAAATEETKEEIEDDNKPKEQSLFD